MLPALSGTSSEYVFTDVSEIFLRHAETKFSSCPFLSMRLLDIEEPDAAAGGFDVAVATNVLHATRDLDRTLENVLEAARPRRIPDLLRGDDVSTVVRYYDRPDRGLAAVRGRLAARSSAPSSPGTAARARGGGFRAITLPARAGIARLDPGPARDPARNEGTGSASPLAAEPCAATECDGSLDDSMLVALVRATGSERREQLINLIRREFAVVLGVADPEMLDGAPASSTWESIR